MNTTKVKERLTHMYGLDVSQIPDEIEDKNTMVQVSCFLHGEYTAKYETLRTSKSSASPGCQTCRNFPNSTKQLRISRKMAERGYESPNYLDPRKTSIPKVDSIRFQGPWFPSPSQMADMT